MSPTKQWPIEDSSMHYIILAAMRIMLAALILLGVGLFVLMGLMSIIRELFADDHHHQPPQLSENDMRRDGRFRDPKFPMVSGQVSDNTIKIKQCCASISAGVSQL
jgi:hypothetical protein